MKLFWITKTDVDKEKGVEDATQVESAEVVLVHSNLAKNKYQQASKVLFTFVPNEHFGQLINIGPHWLTMLNTRKLHLLKYGLLIRIVNNLKYKIMSISL